MIARSVFRSLGVGRLAYRLRHGAPLVVDAREAEMRRAAPKLLSPGFPVASASWPAMCFLTGKAFWHQTIFCADSFEHAAGLQVPWVFHDDGSLDREGVQALQQRFPRSRIVGPAETATLIERYLPEIKYPTLRKAHRSYPLMKKVMDLHVGREGPFLFLDSDMLFFERPQEIFDWLDKPSETFYLQDNLTSYCAPLDELSSAAKREMLPKVNTGLMAFGEAAWDWDELEDFAGRLGPDLLGHRLLEQTLTAFHATKVEAKALPPEQYRLLHETLSDAPRGVLFHYCWHAKDAYFATEWQRYLAQRMGRVSGLQAR